MPKLNDEKFPRLAEFADRYDLRDQIQQDVKRFRYAAEPFSNEEYLGFGIRQKRAYKGSRYRSVDVYYKDPALETGLIFGRRTFFEIPARSRLELGLVAIQAENVLFDFNWGVGRVVKTRPEDEAPDIDVYGKGDTAAIAPGYLFGLQNLSPGPLVVSRLLKLEPHEPDRTIAAKFGPLDEFIEVSGEEVPVPFEFARTLA